MGLMSFPNREFALNHYRAKLRDELRVRKARNSQYSIRSLANSLKVHASALSRILSGKALPSIRASASMAARLKLSDGERLKFISSVTLNEIERILTRASLASGIEAPKIRTIIIKNLELGDPYPSGPRVQTAG